MCWRRPRSDMAATSATCPQLLLFYARNESVPTLSKSATLSTVPFSSRPAWIPDFMRFLLAIPAEPEVDLRTYTVIDSAAVFCQGASGSERAGIKFSLHNRHHHHLLTTHYHRMDFCEFSFRRLLSLSLQLTLCRHSLPSNHLYVVSDPHLRSCVPK